MPIPSDGTTFFSHSIEEDGVEVAPWQISSIWPLLSVIKQEKFPLQQDFEGA
jgi:hypothetical protein